MLFRIVLTDCLTEPIRHRRLGERHPCRRSGRKPYLTTMRDIPMTVPAGLFGALLDLYGADTAGVDELLIELRVTAYTVLVDDSLALRDRLHRLRLAPHREDIGVTETVLGLEEVLMEDRGVRDMTVVAGGMEGVRTVVPSRIVRLHDMTVDTHRRFITEIAVCLRHIDKVDDQSHYRACTQHCDYLGTIGR